MAETKTVGKIILDETFYEGVDRYSDGDIEDELLQIAKDYSPSEYRTVTEVRKSWPVLYHFSPFRTNIVEWLPIKKTDKVLEVGSGCGAITPALAKKAGSVIGIDLSEKRSMINAHRLKDADNVTIKVGNFKDIEKSLDSDYDAIMLIGVFEYAFGYMNSDTPYEDFLNILLKHLKQGGRLYIAIENRMGLKYFAGCTEDHAGRYFEGLEGYPNKGVAKTFTRKGLEKIFASCGVKEYSFYYPYPDYKFPHTIYSDEYLPKKGELHDNIRNFDRERMLLMDETKVFDTILEEEEFPLFSNSYLAVIGPGMQQKMVKYSNDRDDCFGIVTTIEKDEKGFFVTKRATTEEAKEHIKNIENAYEALTKRFTGCSIAFNRCERLSEDTLKFEFLTGTPLEELLDYCIDAGDKEGFLKLYERYAGIVSYHEDVPVSDYDLIFQNILVDGAHWTAIDYEWTENEVIPSAEIMERALWCYIQGNSKREICKEWCNVSEDFGSIIQRERRFQARVQGNHSALSVIRHVIGKPAFSLDYMREECGKYDGCIQIYEDFGNGFSESNSYYISDFHQVGKEIQFLIPLRKGLKKLRIDPGNKPAVILVRQIQIDTVDLTDYALKKNFAKHDTNGKRLGANGFLFTNNDPHFAFVFPKQMAEFLGKDTPLTVSLRIEQLSEEAAKYLG